MREDSHAQTYNGFFVDKQRFFLVGVTMMCDR